MTAKKKKQTINTTKIKLYCILLLLPVAITVYAFIFVIWKDIYEVPLIERLIHERQAAQVQQNFDLPIPEQYIPIYMAAGERYNVPWTLLAAHHRVETRFSTMKTLVSPAGAEGHMQFMPCTFVGWSHPTCSGLGQGAIPANDKTNPAVIARYGGYGVDANGDGIADPYHIEDAVYSAANYLAKAGAASGELKKAIHNYNKSEQYVRDVYGYYELYTAKQSALEQLVAQSP